MKAYVRRWYGYVYAEAEPRKGVPADSIDRTVTLRVASEAQSHALCAKQFHVIPMGVYTRNKKPSSLICMDVAHGATCRLGRQCVFVRPKNPVAVKALNKKWKEKEKEQRKKQKREEKKRQKEAKRKKEEAARKKKKEEAAARKQKEEAARRKKQQEEAARRKKQQQQQQEAARRKKKKQKQEDEETDDDLPDLVEEEESDESLPDLVCEDDESESDSDDSSIPSLVDESASSEEEDDDDDYHSNEEDEGDEDVYYDKVSVRVFEKEIESALNVKAIGNKKFAAKKFQDALKMYRSGLTKLEHVSPKCTTSDAVELVHVLFLNCAAAHIELKEYRKAVSCASKSLAYWPRVKAYYRRGTALLRMKRYEHAIRDFKAALKLRPNDSTVKRCLKEAQEKLKS